VRGEDVVGKLGVGKRGEGVMVVGCRWERGFGGGGGLRE
jgi:hypothetical protein